ncbi:polysaccharide biosynthesis protein [Bacillus sp. AFS015802]|uniref:oligosaccharide flippase family protein n=1 Tax=Bacillus sp. AFS015802 TaxID=2033486 RepID=UPI000BF979F6|nr:oligosaccharide flippase family protein [Bacillus sp. AFS015802]PFA66941.1 polysaccharide biosynthesis protein [Bacillus sp. AFS015802]
MLLRNILHNDNFKVVFRYSSIKYVALVIGLVKGIVNAASLGPELFGILGNLILVLSYLAYTNLGIVYSMNREYVLYESKGEEIRAENVINTTFTALIILSTFLILTGVSTTFFYKGDLRNYLVLIFIIAIFEQYRSFYMNYFRLTNDFKKINNIEIINSIFSFVLIVILIKYFAIYAVLIAMLISGCIIFFYGIKHLGKIKFSIDRQVIKDLLVVGFPLLIYNLGFYIITTIDRVMTIKFLDYKDLGYLTFSNQIAGGTLVFITSVLFLYYPKAIKMLNVDSNVNTRIFLRRTEKYTKYVEVFGVVLCVTGVILIEPFVDVLVPSYDISINIYRILIFGTIVNQIAYFFNVFIVSNKKQIYLIYIQIIIISLSIIFNFVFIKIGMGIIGIVLATSISNVIYSILQLVVYLKILKVEINYIRTITRVYLKFNLIMAVNAILVLFNTSFMLYSLIIILITIILYYKDFRKMLKEK